MKYLLDTHIWIWLVSRPGKISEAVKNSSMVLISSSIGARFKARRAIFNAYMFFPSLVLCFLTSSGPRSRAGSLCSSSPVQSVHRVGIEPGAGINKYAVVAGSYQERAFSVFDYGIDYIAAQAVGVV